MKSFFQLSEHVKRFHAKRLREADGDLPAPKEAEAAGAMANQQTQNDQSKTRNIPDPKSDPKGVAPAEIPDVDLVDDFHRKLENLIKDRANAAALVKMKEIQQTTNFTQQLTNALAELQKAVTELKEKDKQEKGGNPDDAGSNATGSGAGATPAPTAPTPAAPPAPGTTQQ